MSTYTRIKPPGYVLNTKLDNTIFEKLLPLHILERTFYQKHFFPRNVNLSKFNKKNVSKRCKIWSKLLIKAAERRHWHRSGVFLLIFNIFDISFKCYYCWLWTVTRFLRFNIVICWEKLFLKPGITYVKW